MIMIMSKPHTHQPTMNKTFTKVEKNPNKNLGEVAGTKNPLVASEMAK